MFKVRWIVAGIVGSIVFVALVPLATMWLWNWLVPPLFHGPMLTWTQALGLLLLTHLLFRGGRPWCRTGGWRHERWRRRFAERLESMSPEERERLRTAFGRRWGCWSDVPGEPGKKEPPTPSS